MEDSMKDAPPITAELMIVRSRNAKPLLATAPFMKPHEMAQAGAVLGLAMAKLAATNPNYAEAVRRHTRDLHLPLNMQIALMARMNDLPTWEEINAGLAEAARLNTRNAAARYAGESLKKDTGHDIGIWESMTRASEEIKERNSQRLWNTIADAALAVLNKGTTKTDEPVAVGISPKEYGGETVDPVPPAYRQLEEAAAVMLQTLIGAEDWARSLGKGRELLAHRDELQEALNELRLSR